MSDPFRDHHANEKKKGRRRVYEEYEPVVLWVKPGQYMKKEKGDGSLGSIHGVIQRKIKDLALEFLPFVDIAGQREPYIRSIITEFDEEICDNCNNELLWTNEGDGYCPVCNDD